ncbi:MAG: hypothetical protein ACOYOP_08905 [Microthrixaceae bacterium]
MSPATTPSATDTPAPRRRRIRALAVGTLVLLAATACQGPVQDWVPDFNGDGVISDAEVAQQRQVLVEQFVAAVEAQRRAVQAHPFLTCVRAHESDRAGGYTAQNPYSTASGAYQFLDSTWRNVSAKAGHPGYSRALLAPWWVQDAVALWVLDNVGPSPWAGTGC